MIRYLVTRTVTYFDATAWGPLVDVENEAGFINRRVARAPRLAKGWASRWYEFVFSARILARSRRYAGFAVGRYGYWFPILYRLTGGKGRVVLTDTEWIGGGSGMMNRMAARFSDAIQANTRTEIERYSATYGIPKARFVHIPLAFQQRDIRPDSDRGYVLAGGSQGRDWKCFLSAIEGLNYPVKILTSAKLEVSAPNVEVGFVSRSAFYDVMAGASVVVVPVLKEPGRVTGTTTWTAAMAMGKPVIATEPAGAPDYMDHGISGFSLDYGDAVGMRRCIQMLMEDPRLRRSVGAAARERAWREFSPAAFRARVLSLLEARRSSDSEPATNPGPAKE